MVPTNEKPVEYGRIASDLDSFLRNIGPFLDWYSHIEFKLILLNKHKLFFPYLCEINLIEKGIKRKLIHHLPTTEHLKSFHFFQKISDLEKVISGLKEHTLKTKMGDFPFYTKDSEKIRSWNIQGTHFEFPNLNILIHGVKIVLNEPLGVGIAPEWSSLNWELRSAQNPYPNLETLISFLGYSVPIFRNINQPIIELIALNPFRFNFKPNKYGLNNNKFFTEIRIPQGISSNDERLKVGFNLFGSTGKVLRGTKQLKDVLQKISGKTGVIEIPSRGKSFLDLYLSFNGHGCAYQSLSNVSSPNPRFLIHSFFDPDIKRLKKILTKGQNNPDLFEKGVGLLMSILGFKTLIYNKLGIDGEVDAIAFSKNDNVVALCECTIGPINKGGKLAKIQSKKLSIEQFFPTKKLLNPEIIPCVFSLMEDERIPEDEKIVAGLNKVAVLSHSKIQRLIEMAFYNYDENRILDFIRSCVPSNIQSPDSKS